ncbi:GFA family protein [Limimaricola sp.]|uniref:GFA family protein n=1 Tax=Limimaricola sp. TaxID=2211665 RepID=UPI0025BE41F3|nr:GFA family protein [Limimaricola sp.]
MDRTGHCLCGATRYRFDPAAVRWQGLCHCESCRRSTGAPVVGWIGLTDGGWAWNGQAPGRYASSPGVMRTFCTTCGTPLSFASARWPGETHFLAATLEDPADFQPTDHFYSNEGLHWAPIADALPRHEAAEA